MDKRLLPIGTILTLKKMKQKICIIGYMEEKENKKYTYYKGCPFPTGLKKEKYISFEEKDIEDIYFMGYQTEETLLFQEILKISIDKLNMEG